MRFLLLAAAILVIFTGCSRSAQPQVVVYTAWDQIYSEPVLREYERQSGVRVLARYDVEAAKTSGLVQALISQADRPSCDVFWSNEVAQSCLLARRGVLEAYLSPQAASIPAAYKDPQGRWIGFAARARVILYNRDLVSPDQVPRSLLDLADPRWKGRCGLPYPLFGTSASQAVALFDRLGAEKAGDFYRRVQANQVQIVDGNARLKTLVADGQLAWGVVDTDDARLALLGKKPVAMVVPDQGPDGLGALLIPNSVMLLRGAPHAEEGRRLLDYLLSPAVEERLARSEAVQIPLHSEVTAPATTLRLETIRVMPVDWDRAAGQWEPTMKILQEIFAR